MRRRPILFNHKIYIQKMEILGNIMGCIACGDDKKKLAKSHVISNFVRKRLAGELDCYGNKKYKFNWIDRKDLPYQDLPKPRLMCKECDNSLGENVEKPTPSLLMPSNVDDFDEWKKLPINAMPLFGIFNDPLVLGVYSYPEPKNTILDKFVTSTAWRALHAMAKEDRHLSKRFLEFLRGKCVNNSVVNYLFNGQSRGEIPIASLYYMGPKSISFISNKDDELPFAWAELGENGNILGISVLFAYWIIVWPLFECASIDYFDKLERLEKICFFDWIGKVSLDLRK